MPEISSCRGDIDLHQSFARCHLPHARQVWKKEQPQCAAPQRSGIVYFAEYTQPTGYELKDLFDDLNCDQFVSAQSDSEKSSDDTLASTRCSQTDGVAMTILARDSSHQAPRNQLRQQNHKRWISSEGRLCPKERLFARNLRRYYRNNSQEVLDRRVDLHQEKWLKNRGKENVSVLTVAK